MISITIGLGAIAIGILASIHNLSAVEGAAWSFLWALLVLAIDEAKS